MTLVQIAVFAAFALLVRWLVPMPVRGRLLLAGSLLALYWLQPSTPIRNLDFWLPTLSIALTVLVWAITHHSEPPYRKAMAFGSALVFGCVIAVGALRHIPGICCLTPTRPPGLTQVLAASALVVGLAALILRRPAPRKQPPAFAILLILGIFTFLKSEPLGRAASAALRAMQSQTVELASAVDLPWLGFSYLAFRLLHALRDHQSGRLVPSSLVEFATYALFYPAVTAGPIDRHQRFIPELRRVSSPEHPSEISTPSGTGQAQDAGQPSPGAWEDTMVGGRRVLNGLFYKFVLADSLALFALNGENAAQTTAAAWTWVLLYAFALRIFFDFAGYTHIAIGLGRILGIRLPENFDRPYLRPNLTAFWNGWHITLAQWFRAYFFNPLTRFLRTAPQKFPAWAVILAGQLSTMVLIGLWHGITWSFAIWGAWHGVGLFIHNRWFEWTRRSGKLVDLRPDLRLLANFGGWLLTFHFVALGWVWFALPDPRMAWTVLLRLFGW